MGTRFIMSRIPGQITDASGLRTLLLGLFLVRLRAAIVLFILSVGTTLDARVDDNRSAAKKRTRWSGSFLYRYSKDFILDSSCKATKSPRVMDRKALNEILTFPPNPFI